MSFTRTHLWEIFVFLFGVFTSSVLRGQHKTPIYFLYWRMWSALHWTLPGRSPLSSHPSKFLLIDYRVMINSDIYHQVISLEPYKPWTHETTVFGEVSGSQGCLSVSASPLNLHLENSRQPEFMLVWKQFCQLLLSYSMNLFPNMRTRGNFSLDTEEKKREGMNRLERLQCFSLPKGV